jgi:translation initiation factor IF-2
VSVEPVQTEQPEAPAAKSGFSFGDAFGLLKQAIGAQPAEPEEVEPEVPQPVFPAPTSAAKPDVEDEDDIPMPTSSAPPPPYSTPSSTPGGMPMRSARFRRGSRGGAPRPGAGGGTPDIPRIGVVEVDPNFKPRGDVAQPAAPTTPKAPISSSPPERGERGPRGGRGGARGGKEQGERGGERGRGRRGGRGGRGGAGRGPRRFESETPESTNHDARPVVEPTSRSEPPERPTPPTPPPPPSAPASASEPGESFWSKVKRGLTGGTGGGTGAGPGA